MSPKIVAPAVERDETLLYLNEDVFIVSGPVNHAVYNLATGKMYSVNNKVLTVLRRLQEAKDTGKALQLDQNEELIRHFLEIEQIYPPAVYQAPPPCEKEGNGAKTRLYHESSRDKPALGIDFAWLEVTDRCNLKCRHCYEEAKNGLAGKMMTWEDYVHALTELKATGIKQIQFIGGEPMMNHLLRKMITYARPDFEYIEVFTNATMINKEWVSFYKANDIHIGTSVYSYVAEEHDKVTGVKGSHENTTRALALLKEAEVPFRTATVCMDGICVGERGRAAYNLEGKQDPARLTGRATLSLMNKELIERKMITKRSYFSRYLRRESVLNALQRHNCFGSKLYITFDLDVYPCVMERRFCHGNLRGRTLPDLVKREILELTKDKIQGCCDCEYRYACHDCRPDSMSRGKYAKPWYCAYDPYSGQWDEQLAEKVMALKEETL